MSATARSARPAHRRTVDRTIAPRTARRVSGPVTRRPVAVPGGAAVGRQTAFARVRALPDSRWLDRALRGRLWIWLLGVALLGVVGMQVSLLKLNSGISRAVETSATLERQNGALEAAIARLGATDRIRSVAETRGMVLPPAGEVKYLRVRPDDATRATRTMTGPSDAARTLLANGGFEPGTLPAAVGTVAGAPVAGGTATAVTGAVPAATTVSTTTAPATTTATTTTGTTVPAATTATTAATTTAPSTTTTTAPGP